MTTAFEPAPVGHDPVALARLAAASALDGGRVRWRKGTVVTEGVQPSDAARVHEAVTAIPALAVRDIATGLLGTAAPRIDEPTFLRLERPTEDLVDRARATFLLVANARLASARGGWLDGPGLVVLPGAFDPDHLASEIHRVARALRALAHANVAESYLDLFSIPSTRAAPPLT